LRGLEPHILRKNPCPATITVFQKKKTDGLTHSPIITILNLLCCSADFASVSVTYYNIIFPSPLQVMAVTAGEERRDGGVRFAAIAGRRRVFIVPFALSCSRSRGRRTRAPRPLRRKERWASERAIERAFERTTVTKRLLLRRRVRRPRCGGGLDVRPSSESAPNEVVGGRCRVVHARISPRVRWPGPAAARATRARTHAPARPIAGTQVKRRVSASAIDLTTFWEVFLFRVFAFFTYDDGTRRIVERVIIL